MCVCVCAFETITYTIILMKYIFIEKRIVFFLLQEGNILLTLNKNIWPIVKNIHLFVCVCLVFL